MVKGLPLTSPPTPPLCSADRPHFIHSYEAGWNEEWKIVSRVGISNSRPLGCESDALPFIFTKAFITFSVKVQYQTEKYFSKSFILKMINLESRNERFKWSDFFIISSDCDVRCEGQSELQRISRSKTSTPEWVKMQHKGLD